MRADALRKFLGNSVVLANTLPYPLPQVKHLCPKRNKTFSLYEELRDRV